MSVLNCKDLTAVHNNFSLKCYTLLSIKSFTQLYHMLYHNLISVLEVLKQLYPCHINFTHATLITQQLTTGSGSGW